MMGLMSIVQRDRSRGGINHSSYFCLHKHYKSPMYCFPSCMLLPLRLGELTPKAPVVMRNLLKLDSGFVMTKKKWGSLAELDGSK